MDGIITILAKRLLVLSACALGVLVLLARGFSRGLLSPRELGVALLLICVFVGGGALLIMRRTARKFREAPGQPVTRIDEVTRKRRLLAIRAGKAMIALLAISLVLGLLRGGPLLPLAVGVVMNLGIMASLVWWVVRLEKSLK